MATALAATSKALLLPFFAAYVLIVHLLGLDIALHTAKSLLVTLPSSDVDGIEFIPCFVLALLLTNGIDIDLQE